MFVTSFTLSPVKLTVLSKKPPIAVIPNLLIVLLLFLLIFLLPMRVHSAEDISAICDNAAEFASAKTGVPISVLKAISLSETGRKRNGAMRPWPWTVNMEGKGVWFSNSDEAKAYVYKNYKRGARSFDIGCFQISYKWHGHNFSSIEEMFQPMPNALYAANFLLRLYKEKGDWGSAAGAYHSRTPKYASKYEKRFKSNRAAILQNDGASSKVVSISEIPRDSQQATAKIRINTYPLLRKNQGKRRLGSLVQLGSLQSSKNLIPRGGEDG